MTRLYALLAAAALLAACGGDDTVTPTTVTPTTVTPTTVSPTTLTTSSVTTSPVTTSPVTPTTVTTTTTTVTTTTVPITTTVPCEPIGSTDDVSVGFPMTLSALHGVDIRTGAHDCFERVVIEFAGPGTMVGYMAGYWVHLTDEPITLGQTDDQFVDPRGDGTLLVHVGSWMGDMETGDLWGIRSIVPTNVTAVRELYLVDNSEGVMVWAIGLDEARPFRVTTLDDPVRLVIDVSTG